MSDSGGDSDQWDELEGLDETFGRQPCVDLFSDHVSPSTEACLNYMKENHQFDLKVGPVLSIPT